MIALIAGAVIILIILIIIITTYVTRKKKVPDSLKSYIKYNTQMGYPMDALEPLLLNVGWPKELITRAYLEVNSGKGA